MVSSLFRCQLACADYTNSFPLRERYRQQATTLRCSDDNLPVFVNRMLIAAKYHEEWIVKYGRDFMKRNTVLSKIAARLFDAPLEVLVDEVGQKLR